MTAVPQTHQPIHIHPSLVKGKKNDLISLCNYDLCLWNVKSGCFHLKIFICFTFTEILILPWVWNCWFNVDNHALLNVTKMKNILASQNKWLRTERHLVAHVSLCCLIPENGTPIFLTSNTNMKNSCRENDKFKCTEITLTRQRLIFYFLYETACLTVWWKWNRYWKCWILLKQQVQQMILRECECNAV